MELIKNWIVGICAVAIIVSVIKAIVPQNASGSCVQLAGALALVLAVISPFKSFSISDIARYNNQYGVEIERMSLSLQQENEKIQETIIADEVSSYISKRLLDLDIEETKIKVEITKKEDGYLYPARIEITTRDKLSENDRKNARKILERECGVESELIEFNVEGGI